MPRRIEEAAIVAAPLVFVLLWSSGFVAAKFGLRYAEPLTYLSVRIGAAVVLLAIIVALTRPKWPDRTGIVHSAITGSWCTAFISVAFSSRSKTAFLPGSPR